jgi:hypothetical protein
MGDIRLTDRGENLLLRGYAVVKMSAVMMSAVLVMGLVGWIESAGA